MPAIDPHQFLLDLYTSAVDAVSAKKCLPVFLPQPPPHGRTLVIGAGKGAAAMAQVVEEHWHGEISGLVVTRYGHGVNCRRIEVVEAAHPVPDEAGRQAAARMMDMVRGLSAAVPGRPPEPSRRSSGRQPTWEPTRSWTSSSGSRLSPSSRPKCEAGPRRGPLASGR